MAKTYKGAMRRHRNNFDGIDLLRRLQKGHDDAKIYTQDGKKQLRRNLEKMRRNKDETFKQFYRRFEDHLTTMVSADATIPIDKDLAILLLKGLDSQIIRSKWLEHIVNDNDPPGIDKW